MVFSRMLGMQHVKTMPEKIEQNKNCSTCNRYIQRRANHTVGTCSHSLEQDIREADCTVAIVGKLYSRRMRYQMQKSIA